MLKIKGENGRKVRIKKSAIVGIEELPIITSSGNTLDVRILGDNFKISIRVSRETFEKVIKEVEEALTTKDKWC